MGSPGRFVLICLVVLLSATGSSDRGSASTADAVRLLSTEPSFVYRSWIFRGHTRLTSESDRCWRGSFC